MPPSRIATLLLGGLATLAGLFFDADAALAATFVVTSTADSGANTLRQAITDALGAPNPPHVLQFNIAGDGPHTILPLSTFPSITTPLTIDGFSQPGATPNTLAVGNDAVYKIVLDGSSMPNLASMFQLTGAANTIRGFVFSNQKGIAVDISGGGNVVSGNFIGTNITGSVEQAAGTPAIAINPGGGANTIGGVTPATRNVIVGKGGANGGTLLINQSIGNSILNNYIGVNAAGTAMLGPSYNAVELIVGQNTNIGAAVLGGGNVIAGANAAIRLGAGPANGNVVRNNFLNTNATGTGPVGAAGHGITTDNGASNNTIGGAGLNEGNVISGGVHGIILADGAANYTIRGNKFGTDVTGTKPVPGSGGGIIILTPANGSSIGGINPGEGNTIAFMAGNGIHFAGGSGYTISGNSIFANGGLGITLNGTGNPIPNDPGDADTGPNDQQNNPVLTTAALGAGTVSLSGTLNSTASTNYRIEFFGNPVCDKSGSGEGKSFLGSVTMATDGGGNLAFGPVPLSLPPNRLVFTATATNLTTGNTSEFSTCFGAPKVLDIDDNGAYEPLRDGLLALRYLFGTTGSTLADNAVAPNANRANHADILTYLDDIRPALDIDNDGRIDALTDGVLILRYMLGLTGDALVNGMRSDSTQRSAGQMETYLQLLMP